jgi:hypothetical protein
MAINIHNLIAAISPNTYCDPSVKEDVKKLVKEKGYLEAAGKAKVSDGNSEKHKLIYDSPSEGLEPTYFWILDFMNQLFKGVDKITDNFTSSVGSGHFSELQGKATRMQDEAMKILGGISQIIKTILNLVYDLKEFKLTLEPYEALESDDSATRNAALLSLKQRWLDTVDLPKRQTTSIKALAGQMDYVTIIDAFMAARSVDDVTKPVDEGGLDLNDRVKRLLQQRVYEFFQWITESEKQLRKRYEIERNYLKSQVNSLKLYSKWIKPYLKAAHNLEQRAAEGASVVSVFNTLMLELCLLGKNEYNPKDDVAQGNLPKIYEKVKTRKYHPIVIVEFNFRGIPQKVGQHYAFGGRTDIVFTSYALNDQELKVFKENIEKDTFGDMLTFAENITKDSLEQIQEDIDEFINEEKKEEDKKKKEEKKSEDINPFTALFSFFKPQKKEDKKDEDLSKGIRSDDEYEKEIRKRAAHKAKESCFLVFDIFKKSRGMPSHLNPYDW